jgi:GDP-L-fucose synthase
VLPALIRKFHECRVNGGGKVVVWGSGAPRREFMHVDDLADACLFLMDHYDQQQTINVGTGEDVAIKELACLLRDTICPGAEIVFDASMPDGTPRKQLDISRLNSLGWRHKIPLGEGIATTYAWFCDQQAVAI